MISSIQHLPLLKSESFLRQKYIQDRLNPAEIARQVFSCRSTVVRNLKANRIELRAEDKSCTKARTFGNRMIAGRLLKHKRELDSIVKMQELRSQGHSYDKIAQILNAMKVQTRMQKGVWYAKTVRQILIR